MRIRFRGSFKKDLKHIKDQHLLGQVGDVIDEIKSSASLTEIKNITKLKGYDNFYRIRIGDFRLGLQFSDGEVIFVRFLHRKEIYRFFP